MNIKEKIETVVYAYDLHQVGMRLAEGVGTEIAQKNKLDNFKFNQFELKIQKDLKVLKINESTLKKIYSQLS